MSIGSLLFLLIIAALTGAIGARLAGRRNLGCLASIALGFVGALLGTVLSEKLSLPMLFTIEIGDRPFPIIWAVIGSALFIAVLNLLSGHNRQ